MLVVQFTRNMMIVSVIRSDPGLPSLGPRNNVIFLVAFKSQTQEYIS